jgi:hypothetical protein
MLPRFAFALTLLILCATSGISQEYSSLKSYQKLTQKTTLVQGAWLKKDRLNSTETWAKANKHNLALPEGNLKYKTVAQIRDFYHWFDQMSVNLEHETRWFGLAAIAAGQLAQVEKPLLKKLFVRNRELVEFVDEGSQAVFKFAFPRVRELYFSAMPIKGQKALDWDDQYGKIEQCEILEPLYQQLSSTALRKLERMAKGKGFFRFGVPKALRYEGSIADCQARFEHGSCKLLPYYLSKN